MKGSFISLEGTEGCGKSTQCKLLKGYLDKKNIDSIIVREPGSTSIGEQIRSIILDKRNKEMFSHTEALLYAAARAQLVEEVIKPKLREGITIICDRFLDSSLVYQGISRKLGIKTIENINKYSIDGLVPDITFFIDLTPVTSFKRKNKNIELDRIEEENEDFHSLVYNGYKHIAEIYGSRINTIDGTLTEEEVHNKIVSALKGYF